MLNSTAAPSEMSVCQGRGGLGDDDDVDEVVKELEKADPIAPDRSRRAARGGRQNQLRNWSTASRMPR